jgi:hypothetical protein
MFGIVLGFRKSPREARRYRGHGCQVLSSRSVWVGDDGSRWGPWSGKVAGIAVSGWNWNLAWPADRGATGVPYQLIGSMRRERQPPELRVHQGARSSDRSAIMSSITDAQTDRINALITSTKTSSNSRSQCNRHAQINQSINQSSRSKLNAQQATPDHPSLNHEPSV